MNLPRIRPHPIPRLTLPPHSNCYFPLFSLSPPSASLSTLNLIRFTSLKASRVQTQIYGDGELGENLAQYGAVLRKTVSHHFLRNSIPVERFTPLKALGVEAQIYGNGEYSEDLAQDGAVYQKTLRLVECSMFAAVAGLAYFLSNSLAVENYFSCFFALPIVLSSMRWGIAAGRKTMVATGMLLLVLSGPVKALTYLLMHGLVGFTMGTLWRLGTNWGLSVFLCAIVRAFGAVGYVLISSFLIRENILALITINIHTSLTLIVTSLGINAIPSMNAIYTIFGTLLMLNCGFFVFLLHILYAVLFVRLGMRSSLNLPRWLDKAI